MASESEVHRQSVSALSSPIDSVTLYSRRAELHRSVKVSGLKKGDNEVTLTDLPTSLIRDALKVEGTSEEVNVTLKYVSYALLDSQEIALLKKPEYKVLSHKLAGLKSALANLETRKTTLESFLTTLTPKEGISQLKDTLKFQEEETNRMFERKAELDEEIVSVEEEMKKMREDKNSDSQEIGGSQFNERLRGKATVGLWCEDDTGVELIIEYATDQASWTPRYDARLKTMDVGAEGLPLNLSYKAIILQASGEDWKDVKLTLSTSVPSLSPKPPTLEPWLLNSGNQFRKSFVYKAAKKSAMIVETDRASNFGGGMRHRRIVTEETMEVKSANHLSTTFALPGVTTLKTIDETNLEILNDAFESVGWEKEELDISNEKIVKLQELVERRTVKVADLQLHASFVWEIVPRLLEKAFLQANCKNTTEFPLLKGPVSIYLDGTFVAKSQVPDVNTNEKFLLHLGPDKSIGINYPPRSKLTSTSGFLTKARSHTYTQRIIVHNTKNQTLKNIKIIDRIPTSSDSSIIIKLLKPGLPDPNQLLGPTAYAFQAFGSGVQVRWKPPEGMEEEAESVHSNNISSSKEKEGVKPDGRIEWTLEIPPNSKKAISFDWDVSAPVGTNLVGLNDD